MAVRKGYIYITVVIIFLIVMLSVFYTYEFYKAGSKDDTIETRILTMNDFLDDLKIDSERATYISGFRTLIALEEYVSETGEFLDDMEAFFIEAFYNGKIGNFSPEILNQSSFSLYIQRVNQKSNDFDISMNMTVSSINFSQSNPWTVVVDVYTAVTITDNRGLANWNFNETFTSTIPIASLKDPLYSVNTLGRLESFIVSTNITEFVVNNQTDNLMTHIENGYYNASDKAPSFIMRFEGDLSSDANGIENLVDISFLEDQEDIVIDYTRSVVDYIYFGNQTTSNKCNVQNMPSWFKIDEEHINDYEINELNYTNC